MKKIFIVGGQTSGRGGMETAFIKFDQLFSKDFDVQFFIFGYNKKKYVKWSDTVKQTIYFSIIPFRPISRLLFYFFLRRKIKKAKPSFIIAFDVLGCKACSAALNKLNYDVKWASWGHFPFKYPLKDKQKIADADLHLSISSTITNQMINFGIPEDRVFTIYNTTTPNDILIQRPLNEISFLYLGRIEYSNQKNINEIFEALSKLNYDYKLNIVGSGDEFEIKKLTQLAEKLNITNKIIWHGWQENPWDYIEKEIKTVTAMLMSSNYEGFPMILGEAISRGIFCTTSSFEGASDIITKNNGFIYKLNDIDDFVEKLNLLNTAPLPDYTTTKNSIDKFYDHNYYKNLKQVILDNSSY